MILESRAPIEFECRIVSTVHFEVDGVHAHLAGILLEEDNGLKSVSATAESGFDVQLVDEGVVAMELEAEANCQHNVADREGSSAEKPSAPKSRKGQEPPESRASRGLVKLNLSRLLLGKLAHHAKEFSFVVERRFPDRYLGQVTHRFVR